MIMGIANVQPPHKKSTLISAAVNIILSFMHQILSGIFSGSRGLIADGIHSLSDLVADVVVLLANKRAVNPRTATTITGYWRYENGASMILGMMLVAVGVGMLWSAAGKIAAPCITL